jgi:hypothetical protein
MLTITSHVVPDVRPISWLNLHREFLNAGELEILVALANSIQAHSMLEIGVRDGRTARLMLYNVISLAHYVGVDVERDYVPALACQSGERPSQPGALVSHDPLFDLILKPRGSLDLTPGNFDEFFDMVFVDGDHSAAVVRHDSELALKITRPGGIIVWHDYGNQAVEVTAVLDALAAAHDLPIRRIAETWLAFLIR